MRALIFLSGLIAVVLIACSSNEPMPDIEATVEAIVERELKERAPTDSRPPQEFLRLSHRLSPRLSPRLARNLLCLT